MSRRPGEEAGNGATTSCRREAVNDGRAADIFSFMFSKDVHTLSCEKT